MGILFNPALIEMEGEAFNANLYPDLTKIFENNYFSLVAVLNNFAYQEARLLVNKEDLLYCEEIIEEGRLWLDMNLYLLPYQTPLSDKQIKFLQTGLCSIDPDF